MSGPVNSVHSDPSARRLDGKWRSWNTTSWPSSSDGSTAPQTVVDTSAATPSDARAATFARGVTWCDRRACPAPWRGTCATGTPSSSPRVTVAGP